MFLLIATVIEVLLYLRHFAVVCQFLLALLQVSYLGLILLDLLLDVLEVTLSHHLISRHVCSGCHCRG